MKKVLVLIAFLFATQVGAVTFKVGVLAPEGTNWANAMKEMAKEIKKETKNNVKVKFYFGGSHGDEPEVLKKIRISQLHGGVFTGKTLGDINGDVRVVEIPFTFQGNRQKAWGALEKLTPYFNKSFEQNEFVNLGFFEIGMVYFVSKKETPTLKSLNGLKIWSWEGDKIVETMIDSMNLVSVPLPLPDVLNSLQTGIVEAAYAPPMGMIALQWDSKINYVVDFPIAFSVGAFLVSQSQWKKVSDADKAVVKKIAEKYMKEVNKANIKDNVDAMALMRQKGIKFIKFPKKDEATAKGIREKIVTKLKGKLFSGDALSRLNKLL